MTLGDGNAGDNHHDHYSCSWHTRPQAITLSESPDAARPVHTAQSIRRVLAAQSLNRHVLAGWDEAH
jgi:hypothetical protein